MSKRIRSQTQNKDMKINKQKIQNDKWLKQLLPPNVKHQDCELTEIEKRWIDEEEDKSFSDFEEYDEEEEEEIDQYTIKVSNKKYEILGEDYTYQVIYEGGKVYIKFGDEKIGFYESKNFIASLDEELVEKVEKIITDYHLIEISQVNSQLKNKLQEIETKIENINNYKPKFPIYNEFFKVPKDEVVYEKDREKTKQKQQLKKELDKIKNLSKERQPRHAVKPKK